MAQVETFRDKIPPEVEQRFERAVDDFKRNHKDPANLVLHAAGYYAIARGIRRFLTHRKLRGLVMIGFGVAMLKIGHNIEGTEAFSVFKSLRA